MNEMQVFSYAENEVRTISRDGEPWWVLKDVCCILELTSPHKVAERLDDDEKGRSLIPTLGGDQELTVINESGLYNVIIRSDKPEAKKFKRWITHEVLPAIRKTGEYRSPKVRRSLGEVNSAARIITQTLKEAGVAPQFRAVALKNIYSPVGVEIPLDGLTVPDRLSDVTAIATKLGVHSTSGRPHGQAVSAIIAKLQIDESERAVVPFQSQVNGHAGTGYRYTDSVADKVENWLRDKGLPAVIRHGNRSFKVSYSR